MIEQQCRTLSGSTVLPVERKGYLATAVVAFAMTMATLSSNVVAPLYGLYQQRWGFSSAALTGVFAAYAIGVLAAMFLVGPLSDRIGRRPVMLPSLGVVAVGALVFCFAQDLRWLIGARILSGVGTGALVGAASAALVDVDPHGNRQRASTLATIGFTAGAAMGPALSATTLHFGLWPLQLPFILVAVLVSLAGIALYLVPWPVAESRSGLRLNEWRPQRVAVPNGMLQPFLLASGAIALSWTVGSLFAALGPTFATHLLGIHDRALAGTVVIGFQCCGGAAQLVAGRYPPQRTLTVGALLLTVGLGLCVGGFLSTRPALFVVGTVLTAAGFGATFVGAAAVVNRAAPPERRGEVVSALYIVGYITMALPIVGVGLGADAFGLKATVTVFAGLVGTAAVVLALAAQKPRFHR
ncbi:MAG: major facilitator superfamily 1 [Armatimonadetes bacterium]|nr:major facilitator superfamily 1 [Armatimonadota bacterium]